MTRIADTVACELAQSAWLGIDAPGRISQNGARWALRRGLPGDVTLDDVRAWSAPAVRAIADASTFDQLETRVVTAITAALVMGAKLQETNGT